VPAKAGYQKPIVQYYRGIERIPTEPIAIYRWEKKRKLSLSLSIDRQIMPIHYSLSYQNRYNYPIFRVADKKIAKRIFNFHVVRMHDLEVALSYIKWAFEVPR
jgi:hypothetical protein